MSLLDPADDPPVFDARVETGSDHVLLVVCGEADLTVIGMLDELVASLPAEAPSRLVVDASGLEFLDCAVVGWLARLRADGYSLQIHGARDLAARVLDLVGWSDIVAVQVDDGV